MYRLGLSGPAVTAHAQRPIERDPAATAIAEVRSARATARREDLDITKLARDSS
jgi:hypothetical protein